jgi:hypothetical protein
LVTEGDPESMVTEGDPESMVTEGDPESSFHGVKLAYTEVYALQYMLFSICSSVYALQYMLEVDAIKAT